MARKILIADDEEVVRESVKACLETEGYRIYEASNGVDALELARLVMPELVILDILMPEMAGYSVCRSLKEDPQTKDIMVLFLSGRQSREAENTVRRSGGDDFLTKPFEPADLKQKVELLIGRE